ncbi:MULTISPECIES: DUF397 domain-containing protein [Streptomycetaceae]|uniref:DUF397 domain-containing protein n=1 Tax=Streptomycetaceae TaxID=2062 RepID=UPI000939D860|nr:hypothetical protein AMK13_33830 [Streptomyces sp. CB02056]
MKQLNWQKSSFSGEEANCVEIASADDLLYIRESDDPTAVVTTTPTKLAAWLHSAKAGEFDHFTALKVPTVEIPQHVLEEAVRILGR